MSLCKYIKLYKWIETTKEDKTLYKSPCIFSLNFCCCSEDFKTPGITSTLNNLPLPVKHCKFLLWGIGPAAMWHVPCAKWQGRTHKWVHCEHMLPCWRTDPLALPGDYSQTFTSQDMDTGTVAPWSIFFQNCFYICWLLMTQQRMTRLKTLISHQYLSTFWTPCFLVPEGGSWEQLSRAGKLPVLHWNSLWSIWPPTLSLTVHLQMLYHLLFSLWGPQREKLLMV